MEHKPKRQLTDKLINIQIKIITIPITYKYRDVRSKLCLETQHLPILMDGRIRVTIDLKAQSPLKTSSLDCTLCSLTHLSDIWLMVWS